MPTTAMAWQAPDLKKQSRHPAAGVPGAAQDVCIARDANWCVAGTVAPIWSFAFSGFVMDSLRKCFVASFQASFGDIVFGMEDGTVSIFGLVFGVAASTSDTRAMLVAGMTGAIAAAAGTAGVLVGSHFA
jgi:hypothetical protein